MQTAKRFRVHRRGQFFLHERVHIFKNEKVVRIAAAVFR
jgi:hypothetical protein